MFGNTLAKFLLKISLINPASRDVNIIYISNSMSPFRKFKIDYIL